MYRQKTAIKRRKENLVHKRLGTEEYLGEITSFYSKKQFHIPLKRVAEEWTDCI